MSGLGFDPEVPAGFQDADLEQRELAMRLQLNRDLMASLRAQIRTVNASPDRRLGISARQAEDLCDRIVRWDLGDDEALRAYDRARARARGEGW